MKVKYLTQRKTGLYFFRRGIPEDLREFFGDRREIVQSLKTNNQTEAIKKVQQLANQSDRDFRQLRATGERDKAVSLLSKYDLEALPLDQQPTFQGIKDFRVDGNPYDELLDDLAYKHDIGGEYSDPKAHEQRALDILHNREKVTLQEVKELAKKGETSRKRLAEIERTFSYFMKHLKVIELGSIRRKSVQETVDKLLAEGLKTSTVKKALGTVRKQVRQAINLYELQIINPFEDITIKGLGTDSTKRNSFTLTELQKVKLTIWQKRHLPTAQILGLLSDTGCRCGEIGGIELEHIHVDTDIPYLKITGQKNRGVKNKNSDRVVPLVGIMLICI